MVNLEHKLTVDDLIVVYMIEKIKAGCEPNFTTGEFIKFLLYFETKMTVYDTLYDGEKLFYRFFERKSEHDWSTIKNWTNMERDIKHHMDMIYSSEKTSYLIGANYRLSAFDESIINPYFMKKAEQQQIIQITKDFLKDFPKRKLADIDVSDNSLYLGKCCAATIISYIWDGYRTKHIKNQRWPIQCRSIDKFLLDFDLAKIIDIPSIKQDIIDFYQTVSKRIAVMLENDPNLKIKNSQSGFLAYSNYLLVFEGFEEILKYCKGRIIELDFEKMKITETHEYEAVYAWDDDPDYVSTSSKIGEKTKSLVDSLEKKI